MSTTEAPQADLPFNRESEGLNLKINFKIE